MFVRNGTSVLKKVLTCAPTYLDEAAPINEISKKYQGQHLDKGKLLDEYQQLLDAYAKADIQVEQLTPQPSMTNSVFARDFGGCVREGYILGNFKEPLRYSEHSEYEEKMKQLGIPKLFEVKKGLFEGGDFAFLRENIIAVGIIERTNMEGFAELREGLEPLGYELYPVPADSRYLHLDMCFNLVDDNLAVAYEEGLPTAFKVLLKKLGIEIIKVPEEAIFNHGCNLESLGNHRVLSLKQNKDVNKALREHGMDVIELDITETLKAGGGPHCMTFPLKRV